MEYGYITNATPEILDDESMQITIEFAVTRDETQEITFHFENQDDFVKALAYWTILIKSHGFVMKAMDGDEDPSIGFIENSEIVAAMAAGPDNPQPEPSNPIFRLRHVWADE